MGQVNGECGYLEQVIVNPHSDTVAALVVRESRLQAVTHVIPKDEVLDATDEAIRVRLSRTQMKALPLFNADDYGGRVRFPASVRPQAVEESVLYPVQTGQTIRTVDDYSGRVVRLLMSP